MIGITQIDELEFDTGQGREASLVVIDATHFIIAYTGVSFDGFIATYSIDANKGTITLIDSIEHDTENARFNSMVKLDSTHFGLAYSGAGFDGFVKTFSIDGSYNITEVDALEHETLEARDSSIVQIDSTHFMVAYKTASTGVIKTFSHDGSFGTITEVDALVHSALSIATNNSLVKLDSTTYGLAYADSAADGFIKTFTIDGSYVLTEEDSLEYDTTLAVFPSIVAINSTTMCVSYRGTGNFGTVSVFSIDGSFAITKENTIKISDSLSTETSMVSLGENYYAVAYSKDGTGEHITAVSISPQTYNIKQHYTLEHDTADTVDTVVGFNTMDLIEEAGGIYYVALAYAGVGTDGFVKTFKIEKPEPQNAMWCN